MSMARVSRPLKRDTSHLRGDRERSEHGCGVPIEKPRSPRIEPLAGDDDVEQWQSRLLRGAAQLHDAVTRHRRRELDDAVRAALRARRVTLTELAQHFVPRLALPACGALERHDDVSAQLQHRTVAELLLGAVEQRFERHGVRGQAGRRDPGRGARVRSNRRGAGI